MVAQVLMMRPLPPPIPFFDVPYHRSGPSKECILQPKIRRKHTYLALHIVV